MYTEPREPYSFPCMDDCGDGYGNTIYDLHEREEEREGNILVEGFEDGEELEDERPRNLSIVVGNLHGAFNFMNDEKLS